MFPHPVWTTVFRRAAPLVKLLDVQSDISDLTTYTFTGVNAGDVGSTGTQTDTFGANPHMRSTGRKLIIVIVHGEDALATFSVTGVTLGGVAGTEIVDRGGGTVALNTAIYSWDTTSLGNITTTDVVVTWDEAITACAIGVLSVDNIGVYVVRSSSTTNGSGAMTVSGGSNITGHEIFSLCIGGSTCATGTETFEVSAEGSSTGQGCVDPMILYESSNAEIAFAGFWSYLPAYPYDNTPFRFVANWSGTGNGDLVIGILV